MAHFVINGRRWALRFEPIRKRTSDGHRIYGYCSPPEIPGKHIVIDSRLSGKELLDTLLHETHHAASYDVHDEVFVEQTATSQANLLWREGYRKLTQDQMRTLGIS